MAALGTGLRAAAEKDARAERSRTIPGVGPLSALALLSAIDDVHRFERAKQFKRRTRWRRVASLSRDLCSAGLRE